MTTEFDELQIERERHRKTWRQLEQVTGLLREIEDEALLDNSTAARIQIALSQQAEPAPINQCDGCQAGIPADGNGYHRMGKPGGYADLMYCERKRYVAEPATAQGERDIRGADRYRVVRADFGYRVFCVKAGDGERSLFTGKREECGLVASKLAEAFEDGKFVATRPTQTEQQPVGWFTDDHLTDKSATTYDREVADRWRSKGWPVNELYAAPIAQTEQQPVALPKSWRQLIHDTLRNYRMGTLDDGYGNGYPLIDAMTADGQPVSGGIEECTYLADAIWNALISAPIAQTAPQPEKRNIEPLLNAGAALSNIAYNLAQRSGVTLDQHVCDLLSSSRKSWDAARSGLAATPSPAKRGDA